MSSQGRHEHKLPTGSRKPFQNYTYRISVTINVKIDYIKRDKSFYCVLVPSPKKVSNKQQE
jgi:hypothetical protein